MPAWIVVRDRPVAWATSDTPPRGRELASAAAHKRRPRSSRRSRSTRYFFRTTANAVPMRKAYTFLLICSSYLCAYPKRGGTLAARSPPGCGGAPVPERYPVATQCRTNHPPLAAGTPSFLFIIKILIEPDTRRYGCGRLLTFGSTF